MQKIIIYKLTLIVVATLMLTACDAKDACLDSGGSYNEETKQCER